MLCDRPRVTTGEWSATRDEVCLFCASNDWQCVWCIVLTDNMEYFSGISLSHSSLKLTHFVGVFAIITMITGVVVIVHSC